MMQREDLRVLDLDDEFNDEMVPRPVSDPELAELIESMGYVKADAETYVNEVMRLAKKYGWFRPLDSTQGSFRAAAPSGEIWEIPERVMTDAGWVKVPDCEDCSGTGRWPVAASKVAFTSESCPSCAGTGKQRGVFVSRSQLKLWLADSDKQHDLEASFERLLAALEGGTDE